MNDLQSDVSQFLFHSNTDERLEGMQQYSISHSHGLCRGERMLVRQSTGWSGKGRVGATGSEDIPATGTPPLSHAAP